jgi:hypothetical protein
MSVLAGQLDGLGCFVSELQLQAVVRDGDGHVFVAEPARQVEGLAGRLLEGEPQRVVLDRLLHRSAHLGRGAEVPVGRHESL